MKIFKKIITLTATALATTHIFALPAQIIIFPHAEKAANSPHLSAKGTADAQVLQNYMIHSAQLKPDIIIANRTPNQRALGSIETCGPIAKKLHLPLQTDFLESDYEKMIHSVLTDSHYTNKKVLICWDKHDMTHIASYIQENTRTQETLLNPLGYAEGNLFLFKNR